MPELPCCIRTYNNGERRMEWLPAAAVEKWVEYNRAFRFGCALFVNGECRYEGYLDPGRCAGLADTYRAEQERCGQAVRCGRVGHAALRRSP